MSGRLFDWGRDGYLNKVIGWTADTQKAMLVDMTVTATFIKQITNVTNANPAVYTCTQTWANGDVVVVLGVTGNLAANQLGKLTAVSGTTFQLTTLEGLAVQGSGGYISGGSVINLTQAKFVSDVNSGREGTDVTITGTSSDSRGLANSSNFTWLGVPIGNPVECVVIYDAAGGSDGTNRVEAYIDGQIRVIMVTQAAGGSTALAVQPLTGALPNGTVLTFSDGTTATLSALANMGDTSLTVSATAATIHAGATAEAYVTSSGFPVTPNGGNITFTVGQVYDAGSTTRDAAGVFKL